MPSVFLSYAREDLLLIEQLETQLKSYPDIFIWRDQEKIYGGRKWPKVLGVAIADQDVFLLAWSKNSATSHFVELEWNTAIALKKTIVPCLLDDTVLAPILSALHGHGLDDVSGLIKTLAAAPLADTERRKAVINGLSEIVETEEKAVLKQAKTTLQQWVVHGDFYQIAGDFHYHAAPKLREPVLRGRVFFVGDNDELIAAEEVTVTLLQTGAKTFSDSDGLFSLPIPSTFQPGTKVEVGIKKDDWVIYSPIDGEITIPTSDSEQVRIRLVKKGSIKLCSAERIEKFIQDMARKATEQVRPKGKPDDVDFRSFIKDWASRYGFSAQQARSEISKWITKVEQQNDPYQLGLAAYAKKNFELAGKHFEKSAVRKLKQMQEAKEVVRTLRRDAVRDFRLAGDARYNQYEFKSALACYQRALLLVSKEKDPMLWAALHNDIGRAHLEVGLRMEGDQIHHHFAQASQAYKVALRVYSKDRYPQQWATTMNRLSNSYREKSLRTKGRASTALLNQAIAHAQAALTVQTRRTNSIDWAKAHVNLGNALYEKGNRRGGRIGIRLLRDAIRAHQIALKVLTKSSFPQEWAKIQNNLGLTLIDLGRRLKGINGDSVLQKSSTAFAHALEIYTRKSSPEEWAWTQHNIGHALKEQSDRRAAGIIGIALLRKAEKAYLSSLEIHNRRRFPQDYALTLVDLSAVYTELGTRTKGENGVKMLVCAMKSAQRALQVITKKSEPKEWARIQHNLGVLFREHSQRADPTKRKQLIRQEVRCYQLALQVRTKKTMPDQWRRTNDNLKSAQRRLFAKVHNNPVL